MSNYNLATWFLDFAKVILCTLSRETCQLINLRTTIEICSNHLTLSLLLRLTRCERRVVSNHLTLSLPLRLTRCEHRVVSNHLTLYLPLRLTRCEHRVVDRWSDRHGESGTSGLRSSPPVPRIPAAGPWRFPSQTGETWLCLPGQMTGEPARTTAPVVERDIHSIGQSFVYMHSCEHLLPCVA